MDSIHLMTLFMEVFHETSMSEAYRYALRTAWEPGDPGPELDVTSSNSFRQWIKAGLDAHQLLKKQPHVSCITTRVTRLAANLKPFPKSVSGSISPFFQEQKTLHDQDFTESNEFEMSSLPSPQRKLEIRPPKANRFS